MDLESQLSFDEEDRFYSDLRRQILLLTSDDDEEQGSLLSKQRTEVINVNGGGGFSYWRHDQYVVNPILFVGVDVKRFKSTAGTGVFIPQISSSTSTTATPPMRKHNSSTGGRVKCRSRPTSQKRKI